MPSTASLRRELSERNQQAALSQSLSHELTLGEMPSVIFACDNQGRHGNFHTVSWRNICANPQWARRLRKVHTASRKPSPATGRRWMELDCANSSDALLMNIFCYRRRVGNRALSSLLGIDAGSSPEFGVKPCIPLRDGKTDRTEIDMRLGNLLVEAKLTESDFQTAPLRLIERYRDFEEIFERDRLRIRNDAVSSYQLIRGVLGAHATGGCFCVFSDARRSDLIEQWYAVMSAVRSCTLRCSLKLLTWQELAASLPKSLQRFLATKYGIDP